MLWALLCRAIGLIWCGVVCVCQRVVTQSFADAFARAPEYKVKEDWLTSKWEGFFSPKKPSIRRVTGLPVEKLVEVRMCLPVFPTNYGVTSFVNDVVCAL